MKTVTIPSFLKIKNAFSLFFIILMVSGLQAQCPGGTERIYATSDNWTSLGGFLSNGINGFDHNPSTASEITALVGLLGMGGGNYDLHFDQTFPAGTPVSIKMGKQYSGLSLISGFLVYGLDDNGNTIGSGTSVDAGLISLLSADSAFEFTFIPNNTSGDQPFAGVRIYFGGALALADTYKVYEAYVKQPSTTMDCTSFQFDSYDDDNNGVDDLNDGIQPTDPYVKKGVMDLFYGVEVLAGLDALSATASVVHPYLAADEDLESFALLNRGVALLNSAQIEVDFKNLSEPDDSLHIIFSRPDNGLLQLGAINGLQITLFNGTTQIGAPITNTDPVLNLALLNLIGSPDPLAAITMVPPAQFDRVVISYGGVANVLDAIRIHDVDIKPVIETVIAPNVNGEVELCFTDLLSLQLHDNCTTYQVYDSSDNPLVTTNHLDFELPPGLTEGNYTFYVQAIRQGCEFGAREEITVHINPNATTTDFGDILVNGTIPSGDLCLVTNPNVTLNAQLSASSTITNPVYSWYDENDTPITGGSNGILDLGTLAVGTYTYGVRVSGDAICENVTPVEITFTITDEATPTAAETAQEFCAVNNPTAADLQVNESPIVWYDAPTGGNIVDPSTVLTDGASYYAAHQGANCESSARLQIDVTILDEPTPTANTTSQEFCAANNPTAADMQINETPIVWYDAPTGGNIVDPSTVLTDGASYYAAHQGANCESSARLQIDITILDEPTPTANTTSQEFCAANNPTAADMQINESPIVWYDAPTGGNIVDPSTVLTDGASYYAAHQGANCESSARLQIDITILDEPTPTANTTSQEFCAANNPTAADMQINESSIVWYDAPTGGNIVDPSTVLTDGASYYAAHQGANCESSTRLQIDVTILDDGIASLNGETQAVCYSNSYTYTTDANMSDYQWNVTGGTIISGGGINDDFAEVNWDSYPDGTISVSYPNSAVCNGVSAESYNVDIASCSDLTITKTADKENVAAGETVVFTITVENNGTSTLNDLDISENLPSGYTYVSHTTSTGTYALATGNWNIPELASDSSATLMITVTVNSTGDYLNTATVVTSTPLDTDPGNNDASAEVNVICLTVYNEFSPNNDGENDYLIIDCIENYPNNKIEIFNRYGNVVYETASYNNNWNGMANVGGVVSKGEYLPNGTYFYVLKIDELNFSKTGWIYLAR